MSYKDLSIEERIQKASEYAVILSADERLDFDIINELKLAFDLDDEQAKQAYELMRKNHNAEFQSGMRSKIRNGCIAIFISVAAAMFYVFFADQAGWVFLIGVFIFGGAAVQLILSIAKWYREKSVASAEDIFSENERRNRLKQEGRDDLVTSIPVGLMFLLILAFFFFYKKHREKNLNEITVINLLIVDGSVTWESTGGKSPTRYLQFVFKGHSHTFKFEEHMYKYGKRRISKHDFKDGDTLNIEINTNETEEIYDTNDSHTIYILNIFQKGSWLIDQPDRNRRVEKENKNAFIIFLVAFAISCIFAFFWIIYRKRRRSASGRLV